MVTQRVAKTCGNKNFKGIIQGIVAINLTAAIKTALTKITLIKECLCIYQTSTIKEYNFVN